MKLIGKPDFPGAFGDLRAFIGTLAPRHYLAGITSLAITTFLVWGFYRESYFVREPEIYYVENWPANRTDAEIQADQKKDAAELHRQQAERRAAFQEIQKFNERIGL